MSTSKKAVIEIMSCAVEAASAIVSPSNLYDALKLYTGIVLVGFTVEFVKGFIIGARQGLAQSRLK